MKKSSLFLAATLSLLACGDDKKPASPDAKTFYFSYIHPNLYQLNYDP